MIKQHRPGLAMTAIALATEVAVVGIVGLMAADALHGPGLELLLRVALCALDGLVEADQLESRVLVMREADRIPFAILMAPLAVRAE